MLVFDQKYGAQDYLLLIGDGFGDMRVPRRGIIQDAGMIFFV